MLAITTNSRLHQSMMTWRHWLHQHPELAFKESVTSDYIADVLVNMGYEIERGWATTGIVVTLKGQKEGRSIALRADIDALPLVEKNEIPHKSLHDGKMHACGHDGHTTMLLGAAAYLKENNNFSGTVYFIFQPAEEAFGGARVMVEEGLFDQFPCDAVFGMHNWPGLPAGEFAVHNKEVMSAVDTIYISIKGKGGHAAMPDQIIDPIVTSAQLITALQSVVSRNISPLESAVVSITQVNGGHASNVIPDKIKLVGTLRYFDHKVGNKVKRRIKKLVKNICKSMGGKGKAHFESGYPATINTPKYAKQCGCPKTSNKERSCGRKSNQASPNSNTRKNH